MSKKIKWGFKLTRPEAIAPKKGTEKASGYDVCAWTDVLDKKKHQYLIEYYNTKEYLEKIVILPGERARILTGVNLRIPEGYEVQVRPRSGLAYKQGITVLNTPGTVDEDYLGNSEEFELGVILINHGKEKVEIQHGDRIAQIVLEKKVNEELVDDGDMDYDRIKDYNDRKGGFGSTGVN